VSASKPREEHHKESVAASSPNSLVLLSSLEMKKGEKGRGNEEKEEGKEDRASRVGKLERKEK